MNLEYQVNLTELAKAADDLRKVSEDVAEQCSGANYSAFEGWGGGLAASAGAHFNSMIQQAQRELTEQGVSHPATLALIARKFAAQEADASQAIKSFFEGRVDR